MEGRGALFARLQMVNQRPSARHPFFIAKVSKEDLATFGDLMSGASRTRACEKGSCSNPTTSFAVLAKRPGVGISASSQFKILPSRGYPKPIWGGRTRVENSKLHIAGAPCFQIWKQTGMKSRKLGAYRRKKWYSACGQFNPSNHRLVRKSTA